MKIFNFVRARSLNHWQFQHLLAEMNAQYQDLLYYCEVRWLSRDATPRHMYDLRNEISLFMEQKGTAVPEFTDSTWMCDFAFLVDVTAHLNQLNVQFQGRDHFINELFQFVSAFRDEVVTVGDTTAEHQLCTLPNTHGKRTGKSGHLCSVC